MGDPSGPPAADQTFVSPTRCLWLAGGSSGCGRGGRREGVSARLSSDGVMVPAVAPAVAPAAVGPRENPLILSADRQRCHSSARCGVEIQMLVLVGGGTTGRRERRRASGGPSTALSCFRVCVCTRASRQLNENQPAAAISSAGRAQMGLPRRPGARWRPTNSGLSTPALPIFSPSSLLLLRPSSLQSGCEEEAFHASKSLRQQMFWALLDGL